MILKLNGTNNVIFVIIDTVVRNLEHSRFGGVSLLQDVWDFPRISGSLFYSHIWWLLLTLV